LNNRFLLTGLIVLLSALAVPSTSAQGPTLLESIRQDHPIELAGEPVPLEIFDVRSRYEKEMLLTLWDRPRYCCG
jgi:membrane-bound lytic murein transglycosylase D